MAEPSPGLPEQARDAQPRESELPTETEIYILPDGRVVIADLPAELAALAAHLGAAEADGAPQALQEDPLP